MFKPLSRTKRVWVATWLIRFVLSGFARTRIIARFKVTGRSLVPRKGAVLIAANHRSESDPFIILGSMRRNAAFLAADWIFRIPGFGALMYWAGHIRVDRGTDKAQRALDLAGIVIDADGVVVIFPTGTLESLVPQGRRRYKLGMARMAFAHPDVPVVYCHLEGTDQVLPPEGRRLRFFKRVNVTYFPGIKPPRISHPTEADLIAFTNLVMGQADTVQGEI